MRKIPDRDNKKNQNERGDQLPPGDCDWSFGFGVGCSRGVGAKDGSDGIFVFGVAGIERLIEELILRVAGVCCVVGIGQRCRVDFIAVFHAADFVSALPVSAIVQAAIVMLTAVGDGGDDGGLVGGGRLLGDGRRSEWGRRRGGRWRSDR